MWLEEVLGFRLKGNTLAIDPTIPAQWPGYSIVYMHRRSRYRIVVDNPERTGHGIVWIELDGNRIQDGVIPLDDDGREHNVRIRLGRLKSAMNF